MIIDYSKILETFPREDGYRIVLTSMPADPIHPGHVSMLRNMHDRFYDYINAKQDSSIDDYEYIFICLVNDDKFLIRKKGYFFMPLEDRLQIVDAIEYGPEYVAAFTPSDPDDMTVVEAIRHLQPVAFMKGGDRVADETLPEWNVCKEVGCAIIDRVGAEKKWSSSNYLEKFKKHVIENM